MDFASPILDVLLVLLPPFASGPLLSLLLLPAVRSDRPWRMPLFWLFLLLVDGAVFVAIATSLSDFLGPGEIACALLPFTALATYALSLARGRRYRDEWAEDDRRRRTYRLAAAAIPVLQLLIVFLIMLLGPSFCAWGWRECTDW